MRRCATSSAAPRSSTPRSADAMATPVDEQIRHEKGEPEANPLVEGLERLPVHPTTLVIFGATGDLAKRKLLPAIYNLAHEGALPERFNLIGVSRGDLSDDDFRGQARESTSEFSRREGGRHPRGTPPR